MPSSLRAIALTAPLALAACQTDLGVDLFTSDLVAAAEGESFTAPLVLGLELGSENACNENAEAIRVVMVQRAGGAEFMGCQRREFRTVASYRLQVPVVNGPDATDAPFFVVARMDGEEVAVSVARTPGGFEAIWKALPEDLTRFRTFEFDPVITANLNNDLRGSVTIITDDVFADALPVQGTAMRELGRRDQITIRTSDVTNAAFATVDTEAQIARFIPDQ
jgi:hypothetical protein